MTTRSAIRAIALCAAFVVALVAGAVPCVLASPATSDWGPVHQVASGQVAPKASVAVADDGVSVVAWSARRGAGSYEARAVVRLRGMPWGTATRVSALDERVAGLTAAAWGDSHISLVWEREVATDDWQFRMRTVDALGHWGPIQTLRTAKYAFVGFGVDINARGAVVLSWEGGDHKSHVAVRRADGSWAIPSPVDIISPGGTSRFISNPRSTFIEASGAIRLVVWGSLHGTSGDRVWSARLGKHGNWRLALIGPVGGGRLEYNWVPQSQYASDERGDFAAVWSQQDPQSHQWSTYMRYQRAGGAIGAARLLGHLRCDYLWITCADVAISGSGQATVAWGRRGADGAVVMAARRSPGSGLSTPQVLYTEPFSYYFDGVRVVANAEGDAVVNFRGGNARTLLQEFARCPVGRSCARPVRSDDAPSWLDKLGIAVGPSGATTSAWTSGCSGGEACRPNRVWTRTLAAP